MHDHLNIKKIDGISFFSIEGESKNEILIFLPGLGACKENYISHLNNFKTDYETIYCLDLPEQGSKYDWKIGNMVRIIKEFIQYIDSSNINHIHLAGHSAGAIAIISFLVNYDTTIEEKLFNNSIDIKNVEFIEFPSLLPETKKVNKLVLYAPVDCFNIVFPKKLSHKLKNRSKVFVHRLLNTLVNYPLYLISIITFKKKFKFSISNNNDEIQYFNLKISNHNSFFEYVSNYQTLFELYEEGNEKMNKKIDFILKSRNIKVVYGSNDWLLKPFGKRKNKINSLLSMNGSLEVKKFNQLGHLLNHKNRLDFNMNSQMILNKGVIKSVKSN